MRKRPIYTRKDLEKLWADIWARWITRRRLRDEWRNAMTEADTIRRHHLNKMTNWQVVQWQRAGRPKDQLGKYSMLGHGERPWWK